MANDPDVAEGIPNVHAPSRLSRGAGMMSAGKVLSPGGHWADRGVGGLPPHHVGDREQLENKP
jgi:hypothetical protein